MVTCHDQVCYIFGLPASVYTSRPTLRKNTYLIIYDTVVHITIVQIYNTCVPVCICSSAHMIFTGTHVLKIWTIVTCTTRITYEANVYFFAVQGFKTSCS